MQWDYNAMGPDELKEHIDAQYRAAKTLKFSRFSTHWGGWSRQMNLIIKEKLDYLNDKEELSVQYKAVFAYWTVRSKLLENHFRGGLVNKWKRKALTSELKEIAHIIEDPMGKDVPNTLVEMILQGYAR